MRVSDYLESVKTVLTQLRDSYLRTAATLPNRRVSLNANGSGLYPRSYDPKRKSKYRNFDKRKDYLLIRQCLDRCLLENCIEAIDGNIEAIDQCVQALAPEEYLVADFGAVDLIMKKIYPMPGEPVEDLVFRGEMKELLKPDAWKEAVARSEKANQDGGRSRKRIRRQPVSWELSRFPLLEASMGIEASKSRSSGRGTAGEEGKFGPAGTVYRDSEGNLRRVYSERPRVTGPAEPDEQHKSTTDFGMPTRSKNEALIAQFLKNAGASFDYEPVIRLYNRKLQLERVAPDFQIFLADGSYILWEHMGMMDNWEYRGRQLNKLRLYFDSKMLIPRDLILTMSAASNDIDMTEAAATFQAFIAPRLS